VTIARWFIRSVSLRSSFFYRPRAKNRIYCDRLMIEKEGMYMCVRARAYVCVDVLREREKEMEKKREREKVWI